MSFLSLTPPLSHSHTLTLYLPSLTLSLHSHLLNAVSFLVSLQTCNCSFWFYCYDSFLTSGMSFRLSVISSSPAPKQPNLPWRPKLPQSAPKQVYFYGASPNVTLQVAALVSDLAYGVWLWQEKWSPWVEQVSASYLLTSSCMSSTGMS